MATIELIGEPTDSSGKTASEKRKEVMDEIKSAQYIIMKLSEKEKGGMQSASDSPLDKAASHLACAVYKFIRL